MPPKHSRRRAPVERRQKEDARPRRPVGRQKWLPTSADLVKLKQLAALGLTEKQMAEALGISWMTFSRRKDELSEFLALIQEGRREATEAVANVMYNLALNAKHRQQFHAARFWLDRQGGERWSQRITHKTEEGQPFEVAHGKRAKLPTTDAEKAIEIINRQRTKRSG